MTNGIEKRSGSLVTSTPRCGSGGVEEASCSGVKPRKQEELGSRSRLLPLRFPLFRFFASPPRPDAEAPLLLPDPIPRSAYYRSAEAVAIVWIPRLTPA